MELFRYLLIFRGEEIKLYEKFKKLARQRGKSVREMIIRLIERELKK